MGTRSIILITGNDYYNRPTTIKLYKHYDGYPSENLLVIGGAIQRARKVLTEMSIDKPLNVHLVSNSIQAETLSYEGFNAIESETFDAPYSLKCIDNSQWDLEYIYIVDLNRNSVDVYSGDFKLGPRAGIKAGKLDPLSTVSIYNPEYQAMKRQAIRKAMRAVVKAGFEINSSKRTPKSKKEAA